MRFCPNCGTKLQEGVKFCTECGAKVAVTPAAPAEPVYEAPVVPPAAPVYEPPVEPAYEPPVYTPPVEPAYEPPTYTPPAEPTPEPPVYTPPAQQTPVQPTYAPPPAQPKPEKPAKASGEKKPGGKKLLPILIGAAVLVILLIVLLVSCGGKDQGTEADWGRYEGITGAEGDWVELQEKGKVILFIMDNEYEGKWTLDGEAIVIEQGGDEFAGTLKNGTLEMDLAGSHYTFQKPGAAAPEVNQNETPQPADKEPETPETPEAPETEAPETPNAPEQAGGAVTYKLVSASADGEELPAELLEMMGGGWIIFNGDGTGNFALFGENNPITYDDTYMMAGEEKIAYTLTDKGMEIAMEDGSAFVLEVTDETPVLPEPEEEDPEDPGDDPGVPADSGLELWAGDYYGYWIIETVWETQQDWVEEDLYWDCCATLEINPDGTGMLTIWDEDLPKEDPLAQLEISVSEAGEAARFCSEEGLFLGAPVEHADWLWYTDDTEYGDMFVIDGAFEAEGEDFWYCIYLRPWGVDWSDVEANDEVMPYYYYDWYLPMVEEGVTAAPTENVGH